MANVVAKHAAVAPPQYWLCLHTVASTETAVALRIIAAAAAPIMPVDVQRVLAKGVRMVARSFEQAHSVSLR